MIVSTPSNVYELTEILWHEQGTCSPAGVIVILFYLQTFYPSVLLFWNNFSVEAFEHFPIMWFQY